MTRNKDYNLGYRAPHDVLPRAAHQAVAHDKVVYRADPEHPEAEEPRGPWKEGAEGGGPGLPGRSVGAAALWLGQAASIPITKAANVSYRLRGACPIITFGFTLLVTALTLTVFNLGAYASRPTGLPEPAAAAPRRLALGHGLYHHPGSPDARPPFEWATSGGFIATVLIFASSPALGYHVANPGSYDQDYGQLEAAIIFIMQWLDTTDLVVLLGSR